MDILLKFIRSFLLVAFFSKFKIDLINSRLSIRIDLYSFFYINDIDTSEIIYAIRGRDIGTSALVRRGKYFRSFLYNLAIFSLVIVV